MNNNTRNQIIALLEQSKSKIQIAVSWLTDELVIEKLIQLAPTRRIEILLSCDPLNVFRYSQIRELQGLGAKVSKRGATFPGQGEFMHAKFMIIDETTVYGGSFNFTAAANLNLENFNKYAPETLGKFKNDFALWITNAQDYRDGFDDPDKIRVMVTEQFKQNQLLQERMLNSFEKGLSEFRAKETSEREQLIKNEIEKAKLRTQAQAIQAGNKSFLPNGKISESSKGVVSKPHRFYGGPALKSKFSSHKLPKSFSSSKAQELEINKKFPFLQTRVFDDTLVCKGAFQLDESKMYKVRIEYRLGKAPKVYIDNQQINPSAEIHMYDDASLCLFFPGDMKWKPNTSIAENTIPWIFEWIVLYELFLITGKWEAAAVEHGRISQIDN